MTSNQEKRLHHRNSESALILLNGPNLDTWLCQERNISMLGKYDIFGFSTLALTKVPLDFWIYEPDHFPNTENGSKQMSLAIAALTEKAVLTNIKKNNLPRVYHNPPSCFSSDNDMRTYFKNGVYPNYFFIDETNQFTTIKDIKHYFKSGLHLERPLNYRCSMIRSISLCILMGYKNITVAGINPAVGGAWYDKEELKSDLLKAGDDIDSKYLRLYRKIRSGINSSPLKIAAERNDFTKNQAYCLCTFLHMLTKFTKVTETYNLPKIEFQTEDDLIAELFSIFGINNMVNRNL